MPAQIPYRRKMEFEYGSVARLSPNIRRVLANNPSPFTFHGTGTYILGHGNVAVIDPGPALPEHVDAILAATRGETITHVLITHTHNDHSPAWQLLKAHCPAKTYAYGPLKVFVDQASLLYLDGAEVDYVDSLEGSGFKFNNPQVKSTCGCGSSFSV